MQAEGSFKFSLLTELVQQIDQSLKTIQQVTRLSRGKFNDKTFEDQFHRRIQEEAEKVDLLLHTVLNYVKVNTVELKIDTIHTLLEQALKGYQAQWEKKKIRIFKKFEKNLPETVVPDEHLQYILDTILKYATRLMPPNGFIGLMTRSVTPPPETKDQGGASPGGAQSIEISILFDGCSKKGTSVELGTQERFQPKRERLDLELRLIEDMVKKNRGMMETGTDEEKGRTYLSIKFPVERRKVVCFPSPPIERSRYGTSAGL